LGRPAQVGHDFAVAGHPIFAAIYDRALAACERDGLREMRAELLADARGETLEIGAGTGHNLDHYPDSVTRLVLAEPDPHMAKRLRAHALEARGDATEVIEAPAESLPFKDGSFDTVVSTLVLCTVQDPGRAASELRRVLRDDGRLLLIEHVRSPDSPRIARWQDRLERPWGWFAGGCHPNRDTAAPLAAAGFDLRDARQQSLPRSALLIRPAIQGVAAPAEGR
jgi:ubiquinone/menaquinone biosynthesis C-methylase UbiE